MAGYELRRPYFNLSGTLTNGCTALDTSLASTVFTTLPTDYSPGSYLPLVLANDTQGKSEIVWVTGHASAASTVTVVRGREGTSAQAFSAGDVVRCSPTVRDVLSTVTTRSALPGDAHYGMRVLILDEGQVVERTSAGWDDSAPFEGDPTRKHHWIQTGVTFPNTSTLQTVAGLTAAGNHSGTIATIASGQVTLNKAGWWSLSWQCFDNSAYNGNVYQQMTWTNGAFPTGGTKGVTQHRIGASGFMANQIVTVDWSGYVTAAQAAIPIVAQCAQMNTNGVSLTGCQFDFTAEYGGA